jgi:hypothetical protein
MSFRSTHHIPRSVRGTKRYAHIIEHDIRVDNVFTRPVTVAEIETPTLPCVRWKEPHAVL